MKLPRLQTIPVVVALAVITLGTFFWWLYVQYYGHEIRIENAATVNVSNLVVTIWDRKLHFGEIEIGDKTNRTIFGKYAESDVKVDVQLENGLALTNVGGYVCGGLPAQTWSIVVFDEAIEIRQTQRHETKGLRPRDDRKQ
jgi:hypothetical protein